MSQIFEAEKGRRSKTINGLLIATLAASGIGGAIFRDNLRHHSKAVPEVSPDARKILSNELRSSAIKLGKATLSVIAGERQDVTISPDTHTKNGVIIHISKDNGEEIYQMDVLMLEDKGKLKPETTYEVFAVENIVDINYGADGEISLGGDSNLNDKNDWYGTANTGSDLANGQHLNTHNADKISPELLHKKAAKIAAETERIANLTFEQFSHSI